MIAPPIGGMNLIEQRETLAAMQSILDTLPPVEAGFVFLFCGAVSLRHQLTPGQTAALIRHAEHWAIQRGFGKGLNAILDAYALSLTAGPVMLHEHSSIAH